MEMAMIADEGRGGQKVRGDWTSREIAEPNGSAIDTHLALEIQTKVVGRAPVVASFAISLFNGQFGRRVPLIAQLGLEPRA